MASFTKTIPAGKTNAEVEALLAGRDHFLPLAQTPTRAQAGDFIYLIYRGRISRGRRIPRAGGGETGRDGGRKGGRGMGTLLGALRRRVGDAGAGDPSAGSPECALPGYAGAGAFGWGEVVRACAYHCGLYGLGNSLEHCSKLCRLICR